MLSILDAQNLQYVYARRSASVISNLSLTLDARPTLLLGVNGAGKSTLLHLLSGRLKPSAGLIEVSASIGFAPQRPLAVPAFTVLEQIGYSGWLAGMDSCSAADSARLACAQVGLSDLVGRRPNTLSGGELARLGIACAIVASPGLLLLDEPSASLDPIARAEVRSVINKLAVSGMGVVASSHTAIDLGPPYERVLVMDKGQIKFDGLLSEFLNGNHKHSVVEALAKALGVKGLNC